MTPEETTGPVNSTLHPNEPVSHSSPRTADEATTSTISAEQLWTQLGHVLDLRSNEDSVLWTAFGFFGATNAILLVALFANGDLPSNPVVACVVASVGVLASLIWHVVQERALGHIERHEALIERLEAALRVPAGFSVSARRNVDDYNRYVRSRSRLSARAVMVGSSAGAVLLWIAVLLVFLSGLLS